MCKPIPETVELRRLPATAPSAGYKVDGHTEISNYRAGEHVLRRQFHRFRLPLPQPPMIVINHNTRCPACHVEMRIAVGTPITGRPPHRSVHADFPDTAPTSGV